MRVVLVGGEEVGIVVADNRQIEFACDANQVRIDGVLLGDVVLQLDIKARTRRPIGKDAPMPFAHRNCALPVCLVLGLLELDEVVRKLRPEMPIDRNQTIAACLKQRTIHARLVIKPGEVSLRGEAHEIAPARVGFREEHQVVAAIRDTREGPVAPIARGDVGLAPQDGFDARGPGGFEKGQRTEQVAMVGHCNRVHAEGLDPGDQAVQAVASIEQRILRMQVQVDEAGAQAGDRHR